MPFLQGKWKLLEGGSKVCIYTREHQWKPLSPSVCFTLYILWSHTARCGKLNCKYNFEVVFPLTEQQWKNSNKIKLKHWAAANLASRRKICDQSGPQHLKYAAHLSVTETMWGAGSPGDLDGGRLESCQTAIIFFWLGRVEQRLSRWRRAHHCVLGSMLFWSSWSFLRPAKF